MGQIKVGDISVKNLQQELIKLTNLYTKHIDKLRMIINSFSDFQSSLKKSIQTVTESLYSIEASTLVGTITITSLSEKPVLERKI